ncbi:Aste57867_13147 [Aphanomyces stellatus]|uniref:Aste57867_13147 protein n=1 Tax=Aphanomyces stellatus TaxID=120398 RepID=A0A485KXN2_9STRA|nr:hypothetical protein As57867_013098 [Aphanomyces stellatus]VFT89988.1 Aste57867_13147 [Aphanomyces stellatus]
MDEAAGPTLKVQVRPGPMSDQTKECAADPTQTRPTIKKSLQRTPSMVRMMTGIATSRKASAAKVEQRLGGVRTNQKYNDLQPRALGCLGLKNPVREFCIQTVRAKWFERFIFFGVLVNTLVLSLVDYSSPWASGPNPTLIRNIVVARTNDVSLAIFSVEMVLKVVALGFTGPYSYTMDSWNKLDFVVVVSGLVSKLLELLTITSTTGLGALRMLRILRPLRALHSVPGLRILVNSILASLPALLNVSILLLFSCTVFAILGMDLWSGNYHYRCRLTEFPVVLDINALNAPSNYAYPNQTYINLVAAAPEQYRCSNLSVDSLDWTRQNCFWPLDPSDTVGLYCGSRQCNPGTYCGSNYDALGQPRFYDIFVNGALSFSITTEPDFTANLNYGLTSFDDLGSTMIIIFQIVTASGWMVLTENTQDAISSFIPGMYFNIVLFIGMCFLLNLNMAVVYTEYQKAKELQDLLRLSAIPPALRRQATVSSRRDSVVKFFKTQSLSPSKFQNRRHSTGSLHARWLDLRLIILNLATSKLFNTIGMVVTAINVMLICSIHYPSDPVFDEASEIINFVCLVYFIFEMLIKLVAGGLQSYLSDKFNQFDLITIAAGIVEFFVNPPQFIDGNPGNTSPLATLRLVRALKLVRTWKSLNRLLIAIMDAMGEILNFLVFLVIFIYIYALLGMEMFATKYQFDVNNRPLPFNNTNPTSNLHRSNFDTIHVAFMTVFQIITYDNWPAVMYDGWLAIGVAAPFYFLSIIILGVWIVMNMFCAIMVDSVMEGVGDKDNEEMESEKIPTCVLSLDSALMNSLSSDKVYVQTRREEFGPHCHIVCLVRSNSVHHSPMGPTVEVDHGRSLFLFRQNHPIRRACLFLVNHVYWNRAILTSIAVSCIFTALDSPMQDATRGIGLVVDTANNVFAIVFAIEMTVTVVALGFIGGPSSYMRDPWRVLDCFIVIVSLLAWAIGNSASGALSGLRSLRSLRALRPLRVINKLPQLKVVVNTLFRCMPDIMRSLFFFFFMLLAFAVPAVMFFKGAMSSCSVSPYNYLNNPYYSPPPPWFPSNYSGNYSMADLETYDIMTFPVNWTSLAPSTQQLLTKTCNMTQDQLAPSWYVPTSMQICNCFLPGAWLPVVPQKFDNIMIAIGSLYELTTLEGWTAVAVAGIDATGPDSQPIPNNTPAFMVFWIIFIIVCAFFVTNLFIAVLCDSFMREKYGAMVTDEQVNWIKTQRKLLAMSIIKKPDPPKVWWRLLCFNIVRRQRFEYGITACILINMLMMSMTYSSQPPIMTLTLSVLNRTFLAVFALEATLKLIAFGLEYFNDSWNRFDLIIVVLTLISETLPENNSFSAGATALRVFRLGRALRLIKKAKIMKSIFDTVLISLPAVGNVMGLLMLMYYIYAALGVQLFAKLNYGPNMLNPHQNFQSFGTAFQILIGFSTGENWDNFAWECYSSSCPNNSCATWFIVPYFYTFTLVVGYIGLNLFSGIIVDAIGDDGNSTITPEALNKFAERWAEYDPHATGLITLHQLVQLLSQVPPPFGFKFVPGFNKRRILKSIGHLNIPVYDRTFVHFKDVPRALIQRSICEGNVARLDEVALVMARLGIDQEFESLWARTHKKKDVLELTTKERTPIRLVVATQIVLKFLVQVRYRKKKVAWSLSTVDVDRVDTFH